MALAGKLGQKSTDLALNTQRTWRRRGGVLLRRALKSRVDPIVEVELGGARVLLPLSHELPFYRRHHPRYGENIGTLAALVAEAVQGATMIDIGANVGDTAVFVRAAAPSMPLLCVEGDERFSRLLRQNLAGWPDVEFCAPCLLAEASGIFVGTLEQGGGTARLGTLDGVRSSVSSLDDVIAKHSRFSAPALLKSDTDGFEARIMTGAERVLTEHRPVLFLEYDPRLLEGCGSDGRELLAMLRRHGYGTAVVYDNLGDVICLANLGGRLLDDLHRYALRRRDFYLDLAVFPEDRAAFAEELHRREGAR
jgi:FkbM family methyltransferase